MEELCGGDLEHHRSGDEIRIGVMEAGIGSIFSQGTNPSAGGPDHHWVLRRVYETLTDHGLDVRLPIRTGESEVDALGELSVAVANNPRAALDTLEEKYPVLRRCPGAPLVIEAECSTGESKPGQTLRNLAQAVARDRHCLFAVLDGGTEGSPPGPSGWLAR